MHHVLVLKGTLDAGRTDIILERVRSHHIVENRVSVKKMIVAVELILRIDSDGNMLAHPTHYADKYGFTFFCSHGKDLCVKQAQPKPCLFVTEGKAI